MLCGVTLLEVGCMEAPAAATVLLRGSSSLAGGSPGPAPLGCPSGGDVSTP